MRGKVVGSEELPGVVGITPAYAGKSALRFVRIGLCWDYPRVCGEKLMTKCGQSLQLGITPAYAGKKARCSPQALRRTDHPRVCGEKPSDHCRLPPALGSPPRMRGKASPDFINRQPTGITPAYAGKRLKRSRSTVPPVAIVPLFSSVCNKSVVSDGSPAARPSQFPPRIMVISPRP